MFRRLEPIPDSDRLRFHFDGNEIIAHAGDSVAAALLAAGVAALRSNAASGDARAPYCMMGVCFECLVEIDGVGNRQACLTVVAAGMEVRRQIGPRRLL